MGEQKGRVESKRSIKTRYKKLDKKFKVLIIFGIIFCIAGIPMIIVGIYEYPFTVMNGGDGGTLPYVPTPPVAPYLDEIIPDPDPDGNIDLTWNSVSGANEYAVFFKPAVGTWTNIRVTGLTSCSYNANLPDGDYYFKVMASGTYGDSDFSNTQVVGVYTPSDPVIPPSAPNLDEIDPNPDYNGNIYLTWSTVSGVYGYKVYFRVQGISTWSPVGTTSDVTYYFDAELSNGIYEFTVTAYEDGIESPYSNIESVVVTDPPPLPIPEKPVLEGITPSVDNDGTIMLIWNPTEGADYYEVQKQKDDGSFVIVEFGYMEITLIDSGLVDGTYQYRVRAWNNYGESPWSDTRSVIVDLSEPLVFTPTKPFIEINDGDETTDFLSITLQLSCENAAIMSFKISVDGEDEDWTEPEDFDFFKSLTLPEASNNTIYDITVKFSNNYGSIEATDEITYRGEGLPPPPPPIEGDDYTIIYILFGLLVGISVIAVVITLNKKKKRKPN